MKSFFVITIDFISDEKHINNSMLLLNAFEDEAKQQFEDITSTLGIHMYNTSNDENYTSDCPWFRVISDLKLFQTHGYDFDYIEVSMRESPVNSLIPIHFFRNKLLLKKYITI